MPSYLVVRTGSGPLVVAVADAPSGAVLASPSLTAGRATFGLVLPEGALPAGQALRAGSLATQTDVLNTWPSDGSARHLLVSADVPSDDTYDLTSAAPPGGSSTPTWPAASVAFDVAGTVYTATLGAFDGTNTVCDGAVCRRAWKLVTPTTAGAVAHATLQVIFEVTSYAAGGHKVSVAIQNIRNVSSMDKVTADVTTTVAGSTFAALTKSAWTIYAGQRWHKATWAGASPSAITHDFEPWIAADVIPRIVDADPHTYDLTAANYQVGGGSPGGATYFGEAEGDQSDSENVDRQELNPWCDWEARLFRLNTQAYFDAVLANGDQSGGWTWAVDRAGDGQSILRLDQDSNAVNVNTDRAIAAGLAWPKDPLSTWRGAMDGVNSPGYPGAFVMVERQHMSERCLVPYLLTGDKFYLDQLRFVASWAALLSRDPVSEQDPHVWPGYSVGRSGAQGRLNEIEMGRAFGRPFKQVARAAWAMPDALSADQTYFHAVADNNLTACADYIDYIDSRGWGGPWASFVGFVPGPSDAWGYLRANVVASTAAGNPTVLTVVGDDSGIGVGTDDHGMATGDFVDLSGFSGAQAGLNGHRAIVRLTATTFSVAVSTASGSSGVGAWSTARGLKTPHWRISDGAREVSWALFTGLWTTAAARWAFPDRMALMEMAVQDYPSYDSDPGYAHNYYPSPCKVAADDLVFFGSWAEYRGANDQTSSTGYLFDSEANYGPSHPTHRGNLYWGTGGNVFYVTYAATMLAHARRRGIAGADAAYARLVAAAGVLAELKRRPGFYQGMP